MKDPPDAQSLPTLEELYTTCSLLPIYHDYRRDVTTDDGGDYDDDGGGDGDCDRDDHVRDDDGDDDARVHVRDDVPNGDGHDDDAREYANEVTKHYYVYGDVHVHVHDPTNSKPHASVHASVHMAAPHPGSDWDSGSVEDYNASMHAHEHQITDSFQSKANPTNPATLLLAQTLHTSTFHSYYHYHFHFHCFLHSLYCPHWLTSQLYVWQYP